MSQRAPDQSKQGGVSHQDMKKAVTACVPHLHIVTAFSPKVHPSTSSHWGVLYVFDLTSHARSCKDHTFSTCPRGCADICTWVSKCGCRNLSRLHHGCMVGQCLQRTMGSDGHDTAAPLRLGSHHSPRTSSSDAL